MVTRDEEQRRTEVIREEERRRENAEQRREETQRFEYFMASFAAQHQPYTDGRMRDPPQATQ